MKANIYIHIYIHGYELNTFYTCTDILTYEYINIYIYIYK